MEEISREYSDWNDVEHDGSSVKRDDSDVIYKQIYDKNLLKN